MEQNYRKKLIEVALPLQAINEASAREKSIRHGHPSTLHLWWARRPLAACRAVLFAQLVDDPDSDPVYRKSDAKTGETVVDEEAAGIKRAELFNLIEELVQWENSNNPEVIRSARAEIARCVASRKLELGDLAADQELAPGITVQRFIRDCRCLPIFVGTEKNKKKNDKRRFQFGVSHLPPEDVVNAFLAEHAPPVLDPFAGGGSIPLEAQRLGLRAHASDLNPVPVLINKALIEIPPKFAGHPPVNLAARAEGKKLFEREWRGAQGMADDVRHYGQWMRDEAEKRIGHLYPKVEVTEDMANDRPDLKDYVGQKLTVIAWLWARTVKSTDPSLQGNHVPLAASFWLSKKKGKEAYVRPVLDRAAGTYEFKVMVGKPTVEFDPSEGTVVRTGGKCLLSGALLPFDHIREEGKVGRMQHRLMAIVCEGVRGRLYLDPIQEQADVAHQVVAKDYPITDLPKQALSFRVQLYGMDQHWKLFTPRQLTALTTFSDLVGEARAKVLADATAAWESNPKSEIENPKSPDSRPLAEGGTGPQAYADAVATYLALVVSRLSNYSSTICGWSSHAKDEMVKQVFARQAIPMVWDFAESNPFSRAGGTFESHLKFSCNALPQIVSDGGAVVAQRSAIESRSYSGELISTDPPYYDNIGYADLSDFFYVWLRRSLKGVYPQLLATVLTPKTQELIASPYRHAGSQAKAAAFFEEGLGSAIGHWRNHGCPDYPTTIFYAFKQAETDSEGTASTGWETFLDGVIKHGFAITGTWPVRTELTGNLKKQVAALASSVVLACVPREGNAPMATRREFLNALKGELPAALNLLQSGSIAPVDLAQAAIGPGMAVFSRYSKVMEADGSAMSVRAALTLINQVLDEVLAEQEGEFDGDTRWAVAWFEQYGVDAGPYGVAETLSKAKNTSVQGLVEAGVLTTRGANVKLLARDEMPANWDPTTDTRPTCWEATQHLIRRLQHEGEEAAAELLTKLGGDYGEFARDLAYRLYSVCERKKWAQEALAYNGLVVAWPELTKLALAERTRSKEKQTEMF